MKRRERKPHEDKPRGFADWADGTEDATPVDVDPCCTVCGSELVLMCPVTHAHTDEGDHEDVQVDPPVAELDS